MRSRCSRAAVRSRSAIHPDIDNSNTGRAALGFGANDRPNLAGDPSVSDPGPEGWFNTQAFAMPAFGTFGDVGRNTIDGPGFKNINLALTRKVGAHPRRAAAAPRGLQSVQLDQLRSAR